MNSFEGRRVNTIKQLKYMYVAIKHFKKKGVAT